MDVRDVPDRFLVAFSFAGEQRQLILPIAQELEERLGRGSVFYDLWYEHWTAGPDADLRLQDVYRKRAELVVAFLSQEYFRKPWTTLEGRVLRAAELETVGPENHSVLRLRIGDGEFQELLPNEFVPDMQEKTAADVAEFISAKLRLARTRVGATVAKDWPIAPPAIRWPMADHTRARDAFASMLCQSSDLRILLVKGVSDTGKTHMSKQMELGARNIPGVNSGRFDFKGTTSMDIEVAAFADPLNVPYAAEGPLHQRLARILNSLRTQAQPTVLILDTYEAVAETREWIERILLNQVVHAKWLRIVIVGQSVPRRAESSWELVSHSTIELSIPQPEHWLEYALPYHDGLDINDVKTVHRLAHGKPSVMASMFGPKG